MIIKPSNLAASRREFLMNALPAGTLFCLGCGHRAAWAAGQEAQKAAEKKPGFLEGSGLTMRDVFRFAFQWTYIPMIETLAAEAGREKVVEMVKEATGKHRNRVFLYHTLLDVLSANV